MARSLRIEYPGALYHVTTRGNARQDIYLDEQDRLDFLRMLGDVVVRKGWVCHGYCLMTNHNHTLIQTPEPNLSRGMQLLNGRYAQSFNRAHGREGYVLQNRYKAILVEQESYLLELVRYIVLNPVRAGITQHPGDWQWSSYSAMCGEAPPPPWLETGWLLNQFGDSPRQAIRAYRRFVDAGVGRESIWTKLRNDIYLGSDTFVEQMQARVGPKNLRGVSKSQLRPFAKPLSWFQDNFPNRYEAMARAYLSGGHTHESIASHFGVHYRTVIRAVKRAKDPSTDQPPA